MFARILIVIALLFPLAALGSTALAEPIADAGITLDAGSAAAPAATPADQLHDPVSSPAAAWDDVKAAKKVGWASLVFAVLVMVAKLASRLGGRFKTLGTGKVAVVIGAIGALGAACYNAAADGGAWTAMLVAGMLAIAHFLDAAPKAKAEV